MTKIKEEYEALKNNNFKLKFTYPTEKQIERLRIIHKDQSDAERNRAQQINEDIQAWSDELESGRMNKNDFDQDSWTKLKTLMDG